MYIDSTYILVLIGALLSLIASVFLKSTFKKYQGILSSRHIPAEAVAEQILHSAGIYDVSIGRINGNLTDHYDPKNKVLRLSDSTFGSCDIASIGVAAHECGHAVQHATGYALLKLRSAAVPVANIGSWVSWPLILIGLLLGAPQLAEIGVWCFFAVVLFQLITLPVEIDASRRAMKILREGGFLYDEELSGARKVLTAAAMTYVAALASSILQMLRLLLIVRGGNRRR